MANPIDLIIAQQALEAVDKAIAKVDLLDKTMQDTANGFIENSKKMASAMNNITPSAVNNKGVDNSRLSAEIDSLKAKYIALNDTIVKKAEQSRLAEIRLQQQREKAFDSFEKNANKEAALIEKNNNAYNRTQQQINKLTVAYNDLATRKERYNNLSANEEMRLKTLQAVTEKYNGVLKNTDAQIGKNQRNVGNYASGYNALGNSINQLTREAPAFANSINTGFMAISNNIPALTDAIKGIREQNKALAAEGKPTQSVLSQLGSAFFSWNTLISVGVTLLTVYGGKLIDYAFNTDAAKRATDSLTNSMKLNQEQVQKNIANLEYENKIAIELAKKRGASEKEIHDLQVKLGIDIVKANEKNYNEITSRIQSFDSYRLLQHQGGNKAFLFLLNKFNGDVAKARDEYNRREKAYTDENRKILVDAQAKAYEEIRKQNNENVLLDLQNKNQEQEANKKANEDSIKSEEDRLASLAELRKKELELQLAHIDEKLNNEDLYYTDRLTALDKDLLKRIEIAKVDYEEENRLAKGNQDKQKTALINFQLEKLKLIEAYNKQKESLEALDLDAITKLSKGGDKLDQDPFKSVTESAGRTVKKLQDFADESDKISKKIAQLEQQTKNWLNSFSGEFFQNSGFGSLQTFFDGSFKDLLNGSEKDFAVYFNSIAEVAQDTFNFISNASQQNFDNEKARLQSQYDIALTYAGENKAAQEKLAQDLEKQKKDIANRENKAKQKQAIFNIGIDTAQAIIATLAETPPPAGLPLAAVVGALGLAQIAVVASQKIPQYWMGGTHDGGLMMVNDGSGSNYRETIVYPDGKIMQPQGKNVIMDAPAGTEIFTHEQWQSQLNDMLQGKGINWSVPQNNYSGITKEDMKSAMLEAIGEQPQYHSKFDAAGATSYILKKGSITKSASNRGNSIKTTFR